MQTLLQRDRAFSARSGMISRTPSGGAADERSGSDSAPGAVFCPLLYRPRLRALCSLCPGPYGAAGNTPLCDRDAAVDAVAHRAALDHPLCLHEAGPVVVLARQSGAARPAGAEAGALRGDGGGARRYPGQEVGAKVLRTGALPRSHRQEPRGPQAPGVWPLLGGGGAAVGISSRPMDGLSAGDGAVRARGSVLHGVALPDQDRLGHVAAARPALWPATRVVIVADNLYAKAQGAHLVVNQQRCVLVGRLRANAALYLPPPPCAR